jgi:hypothetical protein
LNEKGAARAAPFQFIVPSRKVTGGNCGGQWILAGLGRRGWKKKFLASLSEAAKDIGEVSEEEILHTVRNYRRERRTPQITVAAEA